MPFWFRFWRHAIQAMWRVTRGRWFVWRDAPDDVVQEAAALAAALGVDDDAETHELLSQAVIEQRLRLDKATG